MGSGVLAATVSSDDPRTTRAYAHCAAADESTEDIVVLLLNVGSEPVDVALVAGTIIPDMEVPRTEWHFTASAGLGGTGIRLGEVELQWEPGRPLPSMPGTREASAGPVHMAPQSIAFVRLDGVALSGVC
jgi:hypothetical protein